MKTKLTWLTEEGLKTLQDGYLLQNETPEMMYARVAKSAASRLKKPELEVKFYDYMIKNWLCLATPVASNMGTERGLPISCFGVSVPDSVDGIFKTAHEMAMMSKNGGGVGICLSNLRGSGQTISGSSIQSQGVVSWAKVYDSATVSITQGATRRGATSVNLHVDHPDILEYLKIRRPIGDINRQCLNIHQCVLVPDSFMNRIEGGDPKARTIWIEILKSRLETGEPYIVFEDNVNNKNPESYKNNNLKVEMTNICSEIVLHTDSEHSFVCCLSSLNLAKWDEWKDTDLVETAIWFLDGVMQEFIDKAKHLPGFERSVRFATKSRALGLGVLGWHTLLQSKLLAFDTSLEVMGLNSKIFKTIQHKANNASVQLAEEYGEPEWCKGTKMRNTHLIAIAPTVSNSLISGGVSAGIEPIPANAYAQKTAKGVFINKNRCLERLLAKLHKNTPEIWKSIVQNDGSVQHLNILTDKQKEVFLTAREINQMNLVRQAASRQEYIDQSQSLNLFFPVNVNPKWFHNVHLSAWKAGIKTLYYCRSGSILKADIATRFYEDDCKACAG
jgi:ribonucleoside-diphosphate reductase alpha chain